MKEIKEMIDDIIWCTGAIVWFYVFGNMLILAIDSLI